MQTLPPTVPPPPSAEQPPSIGSFESFGASTSGSRKQIFSTPTLLKFAVVLLALLLLGGGGLYAYFSLIRPPADVLERVITNFSKLETYHFDLTLSGNVNESTSAIPLFRFMASALPLGRSFNPTAAQFSEGIPFEEQPEREQFNLPDSETTMVPAFAGALTFQIGGDVRTTKGNEAIAIVPSIEFGDATAKLNAGGQLRVFAPSKKLFVKIDRLEGLGELFELPPDIQGQWLVADESTLEQMGIDLEELTKKLEQQEEQPTSEDQELEQDLERAFANSFTLTYEGTQELNGQSAFHYKTAFDFAAFKTEILTLREKYKNRLDEPTLSFLKDLTPESLDEFGRVLKRMEGEAWILKQKLLPLKATFVIELADDNLGQTAALNLELSFSKFDEEIVIEEPQGARNLMDLMGPLTGSQNLDAPMPFGEASEKDRQRSRDLTYAMVALLLYQNTSGSFP